MESSRGTAVNMGAPIPAQDCKPLSWSCEDWNPPRLRLGWLVHNTVNKRNTLGLCHCLGFFSY